MIDGLLRGEKKLLVQFKKIIQTDEFLESVLKIRKEAEIPLLGFTATTNDRKNLWNGLCVPDALRNDEASKSINSCKIVNLGTKKIMSLLSVKNLYFHNLVRNYIYFNEYFYEESIGPISFLRQKNLCSLVDADSEFYEMIPRDERDEFMEGLYVDQIRREVEQYPIAIRIHPDASVRDIQDFLKQNSKLIQVMLSGYNKKERPSVRNGKTKINERNHERDDFIYQHRSLPRKEIVKLLREYGFLPPDAANVGKIISLQKKRREKK